MARSLDPVPLHDLERDGDAWISTGEDPQFLLRPATGRLPGGWCLVRLDAEGDAVSLSPVLYVDDGTGFSEQAKHAIAVAAPGQEGVLVRLPPQVRSLRLDPLSGRGRFRLRDVSIRRVGRAGLALRRLAPLAARLRQDPSLAPHYVAEALRTLRSSGLRGLVRQALRDRCATAPVKTYADWIDAHDTLRPTDRAAMERRIASMAAPPVISVVVPLYDTPERFLRRCIESVREQIYPHWELCLADDASPAPHVRAVCEEHARQDPRVKFVRRAENGHIAAASNTALGLATGEFVALLDHDDELAPHALYMVAEAIAESPGLDMVFTDEDKIDDQGVRYDPWFKPDWNHDLMLSQNAVVHLAVYRRRLVEEAGGFRSGFDGSQDYDLTLRVAERTTPDRIRHLPFILYHWRAIPGSVALATGEKEYPYEAAAKAIQEHLDRTGRAGAVVERQAHPGYYRVRWPLPPEPPRVALIIPTKDKPGLLRACVESILGMTEYPNLEIVVVDNRSEERETLDYLAALEGRARCRVLRYDHPYSFAALNNWAVSQTDAPLLAFVNNDIEAVTPGWLSEMVGHALRPEVGAVGARLCYPDGTLQHAGIVVGIGGLAGHPHLGMPCDTPGYYGRAACAQRYSAVTAACMVMRREVFLALDGFDEQDFAVAFNDVDLGLRLNRAGYAVVWTPHAKLLHHESASLGPPTDEARRHRFERECANLRRRWPDALANDPFYNPNLTITGGDFTLASPPRVVRPWERPCTR